MPAIDYTLTLHNLHICDSYKVRKRDMRPFLEEVKATRGDDTVVFARSFFSLKMEWIFHNFLHGVGLFRSRTKDCDLDNPCDQWEWLYMVLVLLTWPFVW